MYLLTKIFQSFFFSETNNAKGQVSLLGKGFCGFQEERNEADRFGGYVVEDYCIYSFCYSSLLFILRVLDKDLKFQC